jgi:predicted TIM-barrel fold metal-dependent hydrolase
VAALLDLLDTGRVWVKTSGVDRVSLWGPPYADAVAFAGRLVNLFPERVLWGTDYPHPNITGPAPDDGLLVDLLADIAPGSKQLRRLLVQNPAEFFDFA